MFADFQNSSIVGFSKKFAIKHLSRFPTQFNCVATLGYLVSCDTENATFIILPLQLLQKTYIEIHSVFYSAAALLAMQSAVIATAIPSVRLSHAGILHRRIKTGSCGVYYDVVKHSSFLIPTIVGADIPFHLKFALKVTHLRCLRRLRPIFAYDV